MPGLDERLHDIYDEVLRRNPGETEFHQAAHEVLTSLGPVVAKHPEYAEARSDVARYVESRSVWEVPCDIALPCAPQNELGGSDAATLIRNGCTIVANMPCTPEAVQLMAASGVSFAPGKAATNIAGFTQVADAMLALGVV